MSPAILAPNTQAQHQSSREAGNLGSEGWVQVFKCCTMLEEGTSAYTGGRGGRLSSL